MFKNITLALLLITACNTQTNDNVIRNVAIGVTAAGCTYVVSKGWAHHVVTCAQTQFALERRLLNEYAHYNGHHWTTDADAALKRDLKANIVHLHNTQRDRYSFAILYDMYAGNPTLYVQHNYYAFPLLQHVADLSWYIKRLKIVRFFHLHSQREELNLLIDQLEYIKHMLMSDHDYNVEEQHY